MNKQNPIWSFERIIDRDIAQIESILFNVPQGVHTSDSLPFFITTRSECIITERNNILNVEFKNGHKQFIFLNKLDHELSIQGEWWYRGTYKLSDESGKTRIIFSVYNIAPYFPWLANLLFVNKKEEYEMGFERFVEGIRNIPYP